MVQPATAPSRDSSFGRLFSALLGNIERVIQGKREQIHLALVCLLAEGHLLIEDVPGVGKTSLAKAIAASIGGTCHRIQFTPDLLPSDVTGVSVWNRTANEFEFRPGGVFANVVLADEINRASPKTQSALLEAMEERQVTVDAHTYRLPRPFMVIATQNPIELEGTYPPARSPARPLPHAHPDGLSRPRRRGRDPRRPGRAHHTRRRAATRRQRDRRRRGRQLRRHACTSPPRCATTSSTSSPRRAAIPTSCSARARAARSRCSALARAGGELRARVRDPRRREAGRARGARAPVDARRPMPSCAACPPTTSCARSWRRCRSGAPGAEPGDRHGA